MTPSSEFENLLTDVPPDLQPVCRALHAVVADLHPEFVELVWPKQRIASYGVGPKKMSEHYVYIAPQSKHVNLGLYHGVAVDDPEGLLEGTGKRLRHVKVRDLEQASTPALRRLVEAAIVERRTAVG